MKTLIQAAEIWVPDGETHLLEFGGGIYHGAPAFGAVSRTMCFGRGEGLPGRTWEEGKPILLKELQGGYFQRGAAAKKAGLTSAVSMPVYFGSDLKAVVIFFCGSADDPQAGVVELWRNDSRVTTDMTLVDGYYGATDESFAAASRETYLPRGAGLPGLAWQKEGSVFLDALSTSSRFVRKDAAAGAGIQRGLAIPCAALSNDSYVLSFLTTEKLPIARSVESWVPGSDATQLQRAYGYREGEGALTVGEKAGSDDKAELIAQAFAGAVPQARGSTIALPIVRDGVVVEALALHF